MRIARKPAVVAGVILAVATIGGIAFALWSATATGSGNATALTAETVTINAATGAADLYPGGPAGSVYFTLSNNNPYSITFDKLTAATVSGVSGGIGGTPACATSDLTVSALPITGLNVQVAAEENPSATKSVAGVVSMKTTAPDACQGAVFTLSLTLTGSQD